MLTPIFGLESASDAAAAVSVKDRLNGLKDKRPARAEARIKRFQNRVNLFESVAYLWCKPFSNISARFTLFLVPYGKKVLTLT